MALNKHPYIYKAIDKAINQFGERHSLTGRQHFAPLLGFTGPNGSIQLGTYLNYTTYNPAAPHPLNIDHLCVLLDELGEDRHIVLDALVREYDLIIVPKKHTEIKTDDISRLVDKANIENSDVFRVTKTAIADNKITPQEREQILKEIEEAEKANGELREIIEHLKLKEE